MKLNWGAVLWAAGIGVVATIVTELVAQPYATSSAEGGVRVIEMIVCLGVGVLYGVFARGSSVLLTGWRGMAGGAIAGGLVGAVTGIAIEGGFSSPEVGTAAVAMGVLGAILAAISGMIYGAIQKRRAVAPGGLLWSSTAERRLHDSDALRRLADGLRGPPRMPTQPAAGAGIDASEVELIQTIAEFVATPNWPAARQVLDRHPELLSDRAEAMFNNLIAGARSQGHSEMEKALTAHRDVLRLCRLLGVDEVFSRLK